VLGAEDESPELKKSISLAAMILKEKKEGKVETQQTDALKKKKK
jgi:hypothetical protein